jgi:hypothetical protein
MTLSNRVPEMFRSLVVRMYWDGSEHPSVEAPVGDFFGLGHGRTGHYSTPYMGVSEGKGFNSFFPMPFSKHCRITIQNDGPESHKCIFYQISYTLGDEITDDTGRFHAHFRRETPPRGTGYVLLDTKGSPGVYVGAAAFGALPREPGTWREGDIRFYMDGDTAGATISGTGWSDWFLSAYGIGVVNSLYGGCTYQVIHPEVKNKYFCSCYRFHVMDPVYFRNDLRIEIEQKGAHTAEDFVEREDDWCSTVYWYQNVTGEPLPPIPDREERIRGIAIERWEEDAIGRMPAGSDI